MTQVTYHATDLAFDRGWISDAALQVVDALQGTGFDGYLVGGCVYDLLLHRHPKDFDITTNASPEPAKGLFRRARIIGRRFKLVHVRFGRKIIDHRVQMRLSQPVRLPAALNPLRIRRGVSPSCKV